MSDAIHMNNEEIKVLLVDDHALLRKGMALLLGSEDDILIVGEAGDGEEAITQLRALHPDVVVMDITMPNLNGIEATRRIIAEFPDSKIIALSIHSAKSFVDDMLNAGAVGYMLKESVPEELLLGIRAVINGEMFLSSAITGTVLSAYIKGIPEDAEIVDINILQSKLQPPPLTGDLVHRTHLHQRLNSEQVRPLTLISAPPGYGKSTLISSCLEKCDWLSSWYSLEKDDSDLRQFLTYFVAAIQKNFPNDLKQTLNLSKMPQLPPLSITTSTLSNELNELDMAFFLVLDNYHHINANSEVNLLLSKLLEHPPFPLHLIIVTRQDPPLQLLTLRTQDKVTEIRMQDLRFNKAETVELIEKTTTLDSSEDALNNLHQEIEGWPAGLRLVTQTLHSIENKEDFFRNLSGGMHKIQEYLFQEVITKQTPQMLEYLITTSILDQFCEKLCEAVYQSTNLPESIDFSSKKFISKLTENNLFAIALDSNEEWFRFHNLFLQLLKNNLEQHKTIEEINQLHLNASQWYENHGFINEAIQHLIIAGEDVAAAKIIERNRAIDLDHYKSSQIKKWLDLIPLNIKQQRLELLLAEAWVIYFSFSIAEVLPVMTQIEILIDQKKTSPSCLAEVDFFRSMLAFYKGEVKDSRRYAENALENLPIPKGVIAGETLVYHSLACHMTGKGKQTIKKLNDYIRLVEPSYLVFKSRLYIAKICIHLLSGDLTLTVATAHLLKSLTKNEQNKYAMAWAFYFQGIAYFHTFQLDKAIECFKEVIEQRFFLQRPIAIDALAGMALAYQLLGEKEQANNTSKELMSISYEFGDSKSFGVAQSAQTRLLLLQKEIKPSDNHEILINTNQHAQELLIWIENPTITQARLEIAKGSQLQLNKTFNRLVDLRSQLEEIHSSNQLIDIITLQCVALEKLGRKEEVQEKLKEAISLAEPKGWVRPFIESGPTMRKMLESYIEQNDLSDFIEKIIKGLSINKILQPIDNITSEFKSKIDTWKGEPLTNRELDILQLLAQRLQNKEIAVKLFVSNETVKTHLKNLYLKLNVHNRRDAITKASGIINANKDTPVPHHQ